MTWTHDPSHYPEPMTALSADVWFAAMGYGIRAAARELRAPFGGFETMITEGGWAYEQELEPAWKPDPDTLERAALDVAGRWSEELMPASHAITDDLRRLRPERAEAEQARQDLDRLVELVREQWRIHFLTVIPVHAAREILHDAYVEHLGSQDPLEPYRLLEGLPNETLDADEELWRIAGVALELDVADVITELPAELALVRLGQTHHGREVLGLLGHYLRRYGGRSRLHELSEPRQAELPELALQAVRLFLEHPRDLPRERWRKMSARQALEEAVVARVPEEHRETFQTLVARVCTAVELEETHAYHIDYPGLAATREALLGYGRRLVAEGRLERAADVFHLRLEELRGAVGVSWGPGLQGTVAARSEARAKARLERPEPYIGEPPPSAADVPPMLAKFYGIPGSATRDGDQLTGTAASAGAATGVARVVRAVEDLVRVSAGEVLVCATTTPAWTPLFPSLAALVTDTGGILCHAAVVAREYGIPAVVGAEVATRAVPDGALVRVDGGTGEVTILRRG